VKGYRMSLLISLVAVVLCSVAFHKPLRKFPLIFYCLAGVIAVIGVYFTLSQHPNTLVRALAFALQKGQVGYAFFTVVMFIGVFDENSSVRRMFNPIRAELSIIGAIVIVGHLLPYGVNYIRLLGQVLSLQLSIQFSLLFACLLVVLLFVLTITSFNAIKQRMSAQIWKRIQMLAYPFYGLIFLHLAGYLIVPALNGSLAPLMNFVIYCLIFIIYTILRVSKAVRDRRSGNLSKTNESNDMFYAVTHTSG